VCLIQVEGKIVSIQMAACGQDADVGHAWTHLGVAVWSSISRR